MKGQNRGFKYFVIVCIRPPVLTGGFFIFQHPRIVVVHGMVIDSFLLNK
jgi:hypothetical protein